MIRINLLSALHKPAFAMRGGVLWRENALVFYTTLVARSLADAVYAAYCQPFKWWRNVRRKRRLLLREVVRLQRALATTQSQLAVQNHGLVLGANDEKYVLQWQRTLDRYNSIVADRKFLAMARGLIINFSKDSATAVTLASRFQLECHRSREYREAIEIVQRKIIGNLEPQRVAVHTA
jgi:hypothetical protein